MTKMIHHPVVAFVFLIVLAEQVASAGTRGPSVQHAHRNIWNQNDKHVKKPIVPEEVREFKKKSGLKEDAAVDFETDESDEDVLVMGEVSIDPKQLVEIDIFSDDFTSTLNGVEQHELPTPGIYGLQDGANEVRAIKDENGAIVSAFMINTETGESYGAAQVKKGVVAVYLSLIHI